MKLRLLLAVTVLMFSVGCSHIRYQGGQTVLRVKIFMDDVNAPDVYFFTHPKLAGAIAAEIEKF